MPSAVTRAQFRRDEAVEAAEKWGDGQFPTVGDFIEFGFDMAIQYVREEQAADQRRRRLARKRGVAR